MLVLANAESRRACAAVIAFEDREITINEFADVVGSLSSESLQVMATVLGQSADEFEAEQHLRLMQARRVCRRLAMVGRCRC